MSTIRFPFPLTNEEEALVRSLQATGQSDGFIKGYIRAGRTFGFTKVPKEFEMSKRNPNYVRPSRSKAAIAARAAAKATKTKPATAKKDDDAPVVVIAKVKASDIPESPAGNGAKTFNKAWPIIWTAFASLPDRNDRPQGFRTQVMKQLMDDLGVSLGSADQLYHVATHKYGQALGLSAPSAARKKK